SSAMVTGSSSSCAARPARRSLTRGSPGGALSLGLPLSSVSAMVHRRLAGRGDVNAYATRRMTTYASTPAMRPPDRQTTQYRKLAPSSSSTFTPPGAGRSELTADTAPDWGAFDRANATMPSVSWSMMVLGGPLSSPPEKPPLPRPPDCMPGPPMGGG